jgi:hypothetical protein
MAAQGGLQGWAAILLLLKLNAISYIKAMRKGCLLVISFYQYFINRFVPNGRAYEALPFS